MKKVIYTCINEGYDSLKEPKRLEHGWDYVCFSDTPRQSPCWNVVVTPTSGRDSRRIKCLAHEYLPGYDQWLYVDATREVVGSIKDFASSKRSGLWLEPHPSKRNCLYKEAQLVIDKGLDYKQVVEDQVSRYRLEGYPDNAGLYRGGVIVRNKGCEAFNQTWWNEIQAGSHRDQVSLPYAVRKSGVEFHKILPGIVDGHFRLHLHSPRPLDGQVVKVSNREDIPAVPKNCYVAWGEIDPVLVNLNPCFHLIVSQEGMIFPRWLWDYLQFIEHLEEQVKRYRGIILKY